MAPGNDGLLCEVLQRVEPHRLVGAGRRKDGKVGVWRAEPGSSVA